MDNNSFRKICRYHAAHLMRKRSRKYPRTPSCLEPQLIFFTSAVENCKNSSGNVLVKYSFRYALASSSVLKESISFSVG